MLRGARASGLRLPEEFYLSLFFDPKISKG